MENPQGPARQHGELCSILCNNLMVPRGVDGGRDSQGVWDGRGHTAVFNMENQQGPVGQHRELCSVSRGSRGGRGVFGRMATCIWMAESLCCPLETMTRLLISYASLQNKKFNTGGNRGVFQEASKQARKKERKKERKVCLCCYHLHLGS